MRSLLLLALAILLAAGVGELFKSISRKPSFFADPAKSKVGLSLCGLRIGESLRLVNLPSDCTRSQWPEGRVVSLHSPTASIRVDVETEPDEEKIVKLIATGHWYFQRDGRTIIFAGDPISELTPGLGAFVKKGDRTFFFQEKQGSQLVYVGVQATEDGKKALKAVLSAKPPIRGSFSF